MGERVGTLPTATSSCAVPSTCVVIKTSVFVDSAHSAVWYRPLTSLRVDYFSRDFSTSLCTRISHAISSLL
ncbi:hypothetical protein JOB18_022946 [Solea senegalensis]|uniref:Uncharacterized protein n=1 Tax=Solea senegalensis TaxID=28829 RepID=A0AAV6RES8_SOLSE|nr:hypothetical protein JOB18_022946 [Solea senegalensis]